MPVERQTTWEDVKKAWRGLFDNLRMAIATSLLNIATSIVPNTPEGHCLIRHAGAYAREALESRPSRG
jgi:hypothetical protein